MNKKEWLNPIPDELLSIHHEVFDAYEPVRTSGLEPIDREMVEAARKKLVEVVTSLLWESDAPYKYVYPDTPIGDSTNNLLYRDIFDDDTRKVNDKTWKYCHVESGDSGDLYRLSAFLTNTGKYVGIFEFLYYYDYLPGFMAEDYVLSDEFSEELRDDLGEGWSDMLEFSVQSADNEEEQTDELVGIIQDILVAYDRARRGVEYSNEALEGFFADLKGLWGELSDDFFLNSMDLFCSCLFEGNGDQTYLLSVVQSKDIYNYMSYRNLLPNEVRETADSYIKILSSPFGIGVEEEIKGSMPPAVTGLDEQCKVYVLAVMLEVGSCCDYSYTFSNANPFFETALLWLDRNLPLLEAKYSGARKGAAASDFC